MNLINNYYEQLTRWGRKPSFSEQERVKSTLEIIPKDIKTILDIGCGDGVITNMLKDQFDVTAMDISKKALAFVSTKKICASIENIPFPDRSYDLVLLTEILEHLPDSSFVKAIAEVQRVSKKYILVSVPFKENLYAKMVKCTKCNKFFNRNWHFRKFCLKDLSTIFCKYGMIGYKPCGPKIQYKNKFLLFLKYHFGNKWELIDNVLCPVCGNTIKSPDDSSRNFFVWLSEGLEWRLNNAIPEYFKHNVWVLVLYKLNESS